MTTTRSSSQSWPAPGLDHRGWPWRRRRWCGAPPCKRDTGAASPPVWRPRRHFPPSSIAAKSDGEKSKRIPAYDARDKHCSTSALRVATRTSRELISGGNRGWVKFDCYRIAGGVEVRQELGVDEILDVVDHQEHDGLWYLKDGPDHEWSRSFQNLIIGFGRTDTLLKTKQEAEP